MSTKNETATTLRWIISNRWGADADHARALELIDEIVGYPRPGEAPMGVAEPEAGSPNPEPGRPRVALVVGHNARGQGAWADAPLDVSEYTMNNQVVDHILADSSRAFEARRFLRHFQGSYWREIDKTYAAVERWGPDFVVELHFNAGAGDYSVVLHAEASDEGEVAARAMSEIFAAGIGTRDEGAWERGPSERGGRSLHGSSAPTVLTEPFFGDRAHHAEAVDQMGADGLASLYVAAIDDALSAIGVPD